jgi:hypothetical protein
MGQGNPREAIRHDLEQFWDIKLQRARERYFKAATEFHRQLIGNDGEPGQDPCVIAGVRRAEAEAFADYCRILATFTELVTIGRLPPPHRSNLIHIQRHH